MKPQNDGHVDWIVVYTTDNIPDAYIVAGRLQQEGIAHYVHQQTGASAFGFTVGIYGEVLVLVRPDDYEQAQAVLYPDDDDILEEPYDDDP
jgi:hypothetical protein